MKKLNLEEIKAIELDLMDELDRICTEQGLSYFLGYGSTLGAVRHQGFIPWDDDIDVIMPRSDYERLISGFESWCNNQDYKLAFYRNDSFPYAFIKMVDTTTIVHERYVRKDMQIGIWVDIFPLEDEPTQVLPTWLKIRALDMMRAISIEDKSYAASRFAAITKRIVHPLLRKRDPFELSKRVDDLAQSCTKKHPTENYIHLISSWRRCVYPVRLFEPLRCQFEDRSYIIPAGYDEYLTIAFGDWHKLPPSNERIPHTVDAYRIDSVQMAQD